MAARIKIAYIIGSLRTGGAEGQLLELLRGLDRHIFDPSLILFRPDTSSRADGAVEQVYSIGNSKTSRLVDRSDLLKFPSFLLRTRSLLRHIKPDVLHAFLPEAVTIVGCLAARAAGVPLVVASRRGSASLYRLSPFLTAAERYALRETDFMLANSVALAQEIVNLDSYPAGRTATIYNGVDSRRFVPKCGSELRPPLGWTDEHVVFGIVANFRRCKRHADFISAAIGLNREFPHTRFLMCGHDRGELPHLTKQIMDAGLRDVFHITTSDQPERAVYPLIDVYVCSSETEGFSNSILEAMACGKPVIATRVGGNAEAVRNGIDGYLIPPYEPEAITAASKSLVRSTELRKKMSAAARQRVVTTFALDLMVKNHEQLYLQLLGKRGFMLEQSKATAV
jgi:glycosyltransferase involved in cell wall biosynthesis